MTTAQIVPAIVVPLLAWRVYRRAKRTIGRQPFRTRRMIGRIVFFSVVTVLFGLGAMRYPESLAALGGGLVLAMPIAWFGLKLTRFEVTPEGRFYTPNTAIGIALIVLLVGRIAYRIVTLMTAQTTEGAMPPGMFQSPVTLFVFGVTSGYYVAYYAGVLMRGKQLAAGE